MTNHAKWTQYWPNGNKRVESQWLTRPMARDAARCFFGYVADGIATHYDKEGKVQKTYMFNHGELR